jgi:hypothetical protein
MLIAVNVGANAIVFAATLWVLFSPHIPTRTGGALVLFAVAMGAFGNIVSLDACSEPEVLFNVAVAAAALWSFWRLELEPRLTGKMG